MKITIIRCTNKCWGVFGDFAFVNPSKLICTPYITVVVVVVITDVMIYIIRHVSATLLAFNTSPPHFSPYILLLHSPFSRFLPVKGEFDRRHSLIYCTGFVRRHRETAKSLCRYSRPFNKVRRSYRLKKNLPLSLSMCRPWSNGHLFMYWPSANEYRKWKKTILWGEHQRRTFYAVLGQCSSHNILKTRPQHRKKFLKVYIKISVVLGSRVVSSLN